MSAKKNKTIDGTIKHLTEIIKQYAKEYTKIRDLLAEVIYYENWHTDKDKLTVRWTGAVVMNRVRSKNWPNTVYDVLYQRGQYTTTKYFFTKELPQEVYEMADDILKNGTPEVPGNVVYQATFLQGSGLWKKLNGECFCYE